MRIRYTIPFKRRLIIADHWAIPIQGGSLRVLEEGGYARALEVVFDNQPLHYAPLVQQHDDGEIKATITERDFRMTLLKRQLSDAAKFLEAFYDIDLTLDEVSAEYEGETSEEDAQILMRGISSQAHKRALPLSFDMLTRAIMAAEKHESPRFEATLASNARRAIEKQEFINSFRYSFLLIESLYGDGQFKKTGLQVALKSNSDFRGLIELALKEMIPARNDRSSDTAVLLSTKPTVDQVVDHLVDKRGFYFHGNVKRKNSWKPDEQHEAEALALLSISVATNISMRAASALFAPEFEARYFDDAKRSGAIIVYEVNFKFMNPEENIVREKRVNINTPGTKVTPRAAFGAAQHCLELFQRNYPTSALHEVECVVDGGRKKVFELKFHHHEGGSDD